MLFEGVILKCSLSIQAERTSSAIFHLLKGKKSIQTVQDIHIYQLETFYGIYKLLTKQTFDQKIEKLINNKLLQKDTRQEGVFIPTALASDWLNKNKDRLPFDYFNGLKYAEMAGVFFDRLMLLIQTVTNCQKQHYSFIPVVDQTNVANWVKMIYKKTKGSEQKLLSAIYYELHRLLQQFSDQEASMFVDGLTGYKYYGLSKEQLAAKYGIDKQDVKLLFAGMTQSIVSIVHKEKAVYPLLSFLVKDISRTTLITKSAHATFKLLREGYTVDQIVQMRQLKENTIYDHIVEIALYNTAFPIRNYVTEEKQREIINAINKTKSYKLKHIKQSVCEDISYFQIRLVLARENKLLQAGD